jgi:murein L,D-transpeptidase YcbB/YkuD
VCPVGVNSNGVLLLSAKNVIDFWKKETRVEALNRFFSSVSSDGINPADTSLLEFWPPEVGNKGFLLFQTLG